MPERRSGLCGKLPLTKSGKGGAETTCVVIVSNWVRERDHEQPHFHRWEIQVPGLIWAHVKKNSLTKRFQLVYHEIYLKRGNITSRDFNIHAAT